MITSSKQLDVEVGQLIQNGSEALLARWIQPFPTLRLQDDQALRLAGCRRGRGAVQSGPASITTSSSHDLNRYLPHIFDAAGVDAVGAHAGCLPLASVDATLGRLQGDGCRNMLPA